MLPLTAEEAVEVQERLVTLEVLLKEVLRRLDSEVTPRHSDHEERLRFTEIAVTEMRVRITLMASAVGTASGVVAGVASAIVVKLVGG